MVGGYSSHGFENSTDVSTCCRIQRVKLEIFGYSEHYLDRRQREVYHGPIEQARQFFLPTLPRVQFDQ